MIESALEKIGLTDGEIKVYVALINIGLSTTGTIVNRSKVSSSKVYEILERLISKGLVSSINRNGVRHFEATPAQRILNYLDEKEEGIKKEKDEIKKIIPQILTRQALAHKSDVKVFMGFDGLKTANEDIIQSLKKGDEWLSLPIGVVDIPEHWLVYFNKRQQVRIKNGAIEKIIINKKWVSLYESRKNWKNTKIRFIEGDLDLPTSTDIYKNKVVIFILSKESPMAIMIENKFVAESFKQYFHNLWSQAKKF